MYPEIKNKVAIVTGAAEGIGLGIAEGLLRSGAKVVLNDIDAEKLEGTIRALDKRHIGKCLAFPGDAGDVMVINGMVDFALQQFGTVDFAIANAGITLFGDFFEFTPKHFQKVINLNLQGAFFLTQRVAAFLRDRGTGGRILLMSSNMGIQAYRHLTAYSMTKAALSMMARSLVLDLAPHQITINAVAPGATLTERTKKEQADYAGTWGKLVPRGIIAKPSDIANTCLFLLSDAAAHINGETIVVDGGWSVAGKYPEDLG